MASGEAVGLFESAFFEGIQRDIVDKGWDSPDVHSSGRSTKEYPNGETEVWWTHRGPEFVQNWIDWRGTTDWQIWETPGGPAIELDIRCHFGEVPVRVILDRVFVTPEGELVPLDIKTGAQKPQDRGMQLGFAAGALEQAFGLRPKWGYYWDARKGALGNPVDLDRYSVEFLEDLLKQFLAARRAEVFIPVPSNLCSSCGVSGSCPIIGKVDK